MVTLLIASVSKPTFSLGLSIKAPCETFFMKIIKLQSYIHINNISYLGLTNILFPVYKKMLHTLPPKNVSALSILMFFFYVFFHKKTMLPSYYAFYDNIRFLKKSFNNRLYCQ